MSNWAHSLLQALSRKLALASLPSSARGNLRAQLELTAGADTPMLAVPPNGRLLVLAPHMDDESFGCGGTLAAALAAGAEVTILFMTDGKKGYEASATATFNEKEVAEFEHHLYNQRKQEAKLACGKLGVSDLIFLDLPDGALTLNAATVQRLQAVIDAVRPHHVFLPFFCDPHTDHYMTNQLLIAATRNYRLTTIQCWGYEIWNPLSANTLIDITTFVETKQAAMATYSSQNGDRDYPRGLLGLNAYRALQMGSRDAYAEAFFRAPLTLYAELSRHFSQLPGLAKANTQVKNLQWQDVT